MCRWAVGVWPLRGEGERRGGWVWEARVQGIELEVGPPRASISSYGPANIVPVGFDAGEYFGRDSRPFVYDTAVDPPWLPIRIDLQKQLTRSTKEYPRRRINIYRWVNLIDLIY